ncbi:MAG: glycosyltransferase family 2 protein [Thermoproteota archaeon]|nr:glycosyltransferase family 2 protein [Thermoproteota archaeon]
MTFDTVPISFSLVLTIFLALYVTRSVIFLLVARNIIKLGANLEETAYHCAALDTQFNRTDYKPFVSVLIASYNEQQVIDRLMKSCAALTYNQNKFEIIVVDDSDDETFHILKNWEKKIQNLKVIHRSNRKGWKGGALNVALNNMNPKSSYALIVDADNVLPSRILESFVSHFNGCNLKEKNIVEVIQGYPIPTVYYNNNNDNNSKLDTFDQVGDYSNWVSKAIDFRLAKRNLIEFVAKDKLSLPIQITGSLFMMRSEVIKLLGFSEDLTEDWDLTLDLYLSPDGILPYYSNCGDRLQGSNIGTRKVLYDPALISYFSTITKFRAYFRQRMRVSEGHTRGFRKNIINILTSNIRVKDKVEFFFVGLQYSKFIAVVTLIIIDLILLLSGGTDFPKSNNFMTILLSVQAAILSVAIGAAFMALDVCANMRSYSVRDVLYSLFLSLCTIPAFVMGSLYGLFEDEGIFYKTERSSY